MKAWLLVAGLLAAPAFAHKASDAYVTIEHGRDAVAVRLDVALRDLDGALGLDRDGDGTITWGELKARHAAFERYATTRFVIASGGTPCTFADAVHGVDRHTDGAYAVVQWRADCPSDAPALAVDYRLMFDTDATHRALVRYVAADGTTKSVVLSADAPHATLAAHGGAARHAWAYFAQGAHHIREGFDHLLFLLSLLLPAVLVRREGRWLAASSFRHAFADAAKIVTAFTLAHSITLGVAALGLVTLPSRLVESAIALSVVLAALNNVRPVLTGGRALAAFAFGLVHGFGFAGALGELGLPDEALALSLAAFNAGVEGGQLVIVALFLPIAYALRGTLAYRRVALTGGSLFIAFIGLAWLVERALDVPLALAWAAR